MHNLYIKYTTLFVQIPFEDWLSGCKLESGSPIILAENCLDLWPESTTCTTSVNL